MQIRDNTQTIKMTLLMLNHQMKSQQPYMYLVAYQYFFKFVEQQEHRKELEHCYFALIQEISYLQYHFLVFQLLDLVSDHQLIGQIYFRLKFLYIILQDE
ncbi:unnamed protein product [Paramecium sonneborni]|uniref:Uncharacterized protein n=1 Tax=Paramecium sonneborni TaxID=65129 RepID=A0A8S1RNH2_9CILI|nr:unnamed protein product [Paramecium sonneborni]